MCAPRPTVLRKEWEIEKKHQLRGVSEPPLMMKGRAGLSLEKGAENRSLTPNSEGLSLTDSAPGAGPLPGPAQFSYQHSGARLGAQKVCVQSSCLGTSQSVLSLLCWWRNQIRKTGSTWKLTNPRAFLAVLLTLPSAFVCTSLTSLFQPLSLSLLFSHPNSIRVLPARHP